LEAEVRKNCKMNLTSIATIVTPSANTEQLLALIALIVFGVAAIAALMTRTYYAVLIAGGLAVLAAAILWRLGRSRRP
jgi:hypothetical protein